MRTDPIGPYETEIELGRGAMGLVHRARHARTGQVVALKTVAETNAKWLEGIRREILTLTRVSHPGVVRIVEHGVHGGRPWYAMDLLVGETLQQFKARIWSPYYRPSRPVPSSELVSRTVDFSSTTDGSDGSEVPIESGVIPIFPSVVAASSEDGVDSSRMRTEVAAGELDVVLKIGRRLCATLAFLHGEGFVSCDLKPENVMLVDGRPIIIDFGLAAHHPGDSGREAIVSPRRMTGTLPYMSPEQIKGEFVDARSDLYSVGCLMYEMLAGEKPFKGSPQEIVRGHLTIPPSPLSEHVLGVPDELERIVMKLLGKTPADRFGYADEVARAIAELSRDTEALHGFPAPRSYLYRPRFAGRGELLRQLTELRERAAAGCGGMALLGGESGVGKTRLAMELTRFQSLTPMRIVTGETSALSIDSDTKVGPSPLHGLRPLLQAIVDRCLEGGEDVTEQLLGHRRAMLALYEPLFAQVPAHGALPPVPPLGADVFRSRLFKYLAETITAFAEERPLLWVLDDAGWADELSLAFLASLSHEYLERTPIFVLCCYRAEEISDGIAAIANNEHVLHLSVPRLDRGALGSMIGDILAIREPPEGFVSFIADQAEGNPFFVAEYLRAAVAERILFRNHEDAWQLLPQSHASVAGYEHLRLPGSLRELIEYRLGRLGETAQRVAMSAAVLGRECELDVLVEVAGLAADDAVTAIDELVARQVIERAPDNELRFGHDKLREVAYARTPHDLLVDLHARAAGVLEKRVAKRPEANRFWATLGHHFSVAQKAAKAASYLKLAADHARSTHANSDAIRLYREAAKQVRHAEITMALEPAAARESLLDLSEALGDVLGLTGLGVEARAAYEEALGYTTQASLLTRARVYRKLAKTWERVHPHEEAIRLYQCARQTLGESPPTAFAEAWRDEWVQLRCDQVFANYWLGRVEEIAGLVTELEAAVPPNASPWQLVRLHRAQLHFGFRRDRYVLDGQGVEYARAALNACLACGDLGDLPLAHFNFAFALFLNGDFEAADWELRSALAIAERTGDVTHQGRCLVYLSINARRRGRVSDAEGYLPRMRAIAEVARMRDYFGVACANEAWLDWMRGAYDSCERLAHTALSAWRELPFRYAFQWTALWPLFDARLRAHDLAGASQLAEALLEPNQQRLPEDASEALEQGLLAAGAQQGARAEAHFRQAVAAAQQHRFL